MTVENPFTLTFGKQPTRFISRFEDSERIISTFCADHAVTQVFLIEGLRGSGKTVLMTTVAKQLAEEKEWIVINLNPAMDLLSEFAIRLSELSNSRPELLNKGFQVSAAGFGIGINAEEKPADSVGALEKAFKTILKKKKRVLVTIDEVANDENMRVFASQFQIFVRQDFPIYLIMTGLHENITEIQNDPALTFLLRTPKIKTEPLSILQITRQYRDIFQLSEDEAHALANITKGYAFGFQALGVCFWDYRDKGMSFVLERFEELLDDFVYKKIWSTLAQKEREIVLAISGEEKPVGEVCQELSISNGTFSKYREALISKGILESKKYGYVSLSLPRFYEVVRNYAG